MRLIQWEKKGKLEYWQTYHWQKQQWQNDNRYTLAGQAQVFQFLSHQKTSFEWALIGLNMAYRNTFYALMPNVHVIILPQHLFGYMRHFWKLPSGYHEEVAVSIDTSLQQKWQEVYGFLESFYAAKTLQEAKALYDNWQLDRALDNVIADKLQLVIQLFEEEIFNYFMYGAFLPKVLQDPDSVYDS